MGKPVVISLEERLQSTAKNLLDTLFALKAKEQVEAIQNWAAKQISHPGQQKVLIASEASDVLRVYVKHLLLDNEALRREKDELMEIIAQDDPPPTWPDDQG
jgi:hypothetical protein